MSEEQGKFDNFVAVVAKLRAPDGCPWDRQQTHKTIRRYLIEETYEVIEAIDESSGEHLKEELGDLLFQVLLHAQIAQEDGLFDIYDVIDSIHKKMIDRHPHVFGATRTNSAEAVRTDWERNKRDVRLNRDKQASILDGIPKSMPALLQAARLGDKAAQAGFDWDSKEKVEISLAEELNELQEAGKGGVMEEITHEFGDVLFTLVNLGRFLQVDPEAALNKTNRRFESRFTYVEQALRKAGKKPEDVELAELDRLWEQAKRELEHSSGSA